MSVINTNVKALTAQKAIQENSRTLTTAIDNTACVRFDTTAAIVCQDIVWNHCSFSGMVYGIKTAEQLGVAAATKGGIFAKILNLLKGGLSKVIGVIGKAAEWIGEKLGLIWLKNFGVKAQSFMTKTVDSSIKVAESNGMKVAAGTEKKSLVTKVKDFKFTKPTPVVVKSTGKTIMVTALLCSALGLEGWTCQHKIENGEISDEELALAMGSKQQISDKLNQLSDAQIKDLNLF